jgi:hypothetical protein
VTVRGRDWKSSLGLTCRAIEATVESCELDTVRVISERKLVLTKPALGIAMIALGPSDFENFITHPRMRPPSVPAKPASQIRFLKDGARIDSSSGIVSFFSDFEGRRYECMMKRGGSQCSSRGRALVAVRPVVTTDATQSSDSVRQLEQALGQFFNEMVFELDGTFLSFRDLMVTGKGSAPAVMLSLGIRVNKFPSRRLAF